MRTDVKVGLICAFAIVLSVIIFFVVRGKPQPVAARAETNTNSSRVTSNSDLRPATAGTPSNPTVSSDLILPDHTLAGSPIGGGMIAPPGAGATPPATPAVTTSTPSMTTTPASSGTPGTPGMGATPTTPTITSTPTTVVPTSTLSTTSTPSTPTMVLGMGPTLPTTSSPTSTTGATTYKIQKGDMLAVIAKNNKVTVKALEIANPSVDPNRLKIGDVLKIPAPTAAATTVTPGAGTPTRATTSTPAVATGRPSSTTSLTSAHPATPTTLRPGSVYVIKKGDTLASISKAAYGSSSGTQKIFRANRSELDDPDVMPIGASIKIP